MKCSAGRKCRWRRFRREYWQVCPVIDITPRANIQLKFVPRTTKSDKISERLGSLMYMLSHFRPGDEDSVLCKSKHIEHSVHGRSII